VGIAPLELPDLVAAAAAAPATPASAVAAEGEVVGWGRKATWSDPDAFTASSLIARELVRMGVRDAFGVLGGGIAAFAEGLRRSPIRFVHTRHEAGAAFAAVEAHFASARPALVVVTTGPGLWNALNGAMAARMDGAKLLVVSGATSAALLGRGAVQESGPSTSPAGLTTAGPLFHLAARPESAAELVHFLQQLASGWTRPGGFVAHLALPWSLQVQLLEGHQAPPVAMWSVAAPTADERTLDDVLARLAAGPSMLWIGHGARHAAEEVRRFAEAAQLPVVCSPRSKGVIDEHHPLFVGVSGAGGHASVHAFFAEARPATALVLGTRLGEVTSFLSAANTPRQGWIHVDLDSTAFAAAFPGVPGLGVVAEARSFLAALHTRAEATGWFQRRAATSVAAVAATLPRQDHPLLVPRGTSHGDVRPAYAMQVVQRLVVEGSDAIVMSEAGNSFTWCNYALRFATPGRYRTSAAWGSMGHFTAGCLGAALATGRRAFAIVGDGAMLMNNEINTAVAYHADVVWLVLNDAQLGLNEHGMRALGMAPIETQLPRTDFAWFARCQGATGLTVLGEAELAPAIEQAMTTPGPVVIDVRIDPSVPSPILALRIKSIQQGAAQ
jgi:acetolactate synthase I/II/III large subunit